MNINDVKRVCVLGGGLMGRQIALNTAIHGYKVTLNDSSAVAVEKVRAWLEEYLAGRVAKGKMTKEETETYKGRLKITGGLEEAVTDSQLIIEAIVEIRDAKFELFKKLNKLIPRDTIVTTNSSTMVSSMFKQFVDNPSRLANLHYFNPALVMKLVEVVQGDHTSNETAELLMEFCRRTGKTPIHLTKECEGFVVNRALGALKTECLKIVDEGICTPQEIDMGLELGLNHPMGVFRLNDLTGIDLYFHLLEQMYKDRGVKPLGYDLYQGMVSRGELGQKTGKGFYTYTKQG